MREICRSNSLVGGVVGLAAALFWVTGCGTTETGGAASAEQTQTDELPAPEEQARRDDQAKVADREHPPPALEGEPPSTASSASGESMAKSELVASVAPATSSASSARSTRGAKRDKPIAKVRARPYLNELIVKPAAGVDEAALQVALGSVGGSGVQLRPSILGRYLATFSSTDPPRDEQGQLELLQSVRALDAVESAEPSKIHKPAGG